MLITINQQQIERIEYKGQPVITLPMIDQLHERSEGTAKRTLHENREWFREGDDFFKVPYEVWSTLLAGRLTSHQNTEGQGGHRGDMYLFTQSGYAMIAKPFRDKLAWKVQRELVDYYFQPEKASRTQSAISKDEHLALLQEISRLQTELLAMKDAEIARLNEPKKKIQPLSDDERQLILDLWGQNMSKRKIAKETGRSTRSVTRVITGTR